MQGSPGVDQGPTGDQPLIGELVEPSVHELAVQVPAFLDRLLVRGELVDLVDAVVAVQDGGRLV